MFNIAKFRSYLGQNQNLNIFRFRCMFIIFHANSLEIAWRKRCFPCALRTPHYTHMARVARRDTMWVTRTCWAFRSKSGRILDKNLVENAFFKTISFSGLDSHFKLQSMLTFFNLRSRPTFQSPVSTHISISNVVS